MKYKIEVVERESNKTEAVVGENLTEYYAERAYESTKLLIDTDKYEVRVSHAF